MLPPVLERLPVEVVRCYFEPDGSFPNHEPNPLLPENREFIVAKTLEEGADLGVAFDGDADRCFFVDDTGEFVPGDFATALLAESLLAKEPGAKVIYDVRASWAVPETIERGRRRAARQPGRARVHQAADAEGGRGVRRRGVGPLLLPRLHAGRLGGRAVPAHARDRLAEAAGSCPRSSQPFRSRYFITGEINTPVADVALKLQELKERYAGEGTHLAPRRDLGRGGRLALQRAPVEHRAAAAPEPRGPLAGADGAQARRGARAHPLVAASPAGSHAARTAAPTRGCQTPGHVPKRRARQAQRGRSPASGRGRPGLRPPPASPAPARGPSWRGSCCPANPRLPRLRMQTRGLRFTYAVDATKWASVATSTLKKRFWKRWPVRPWRQLIACA